MGEFRNLTSINTFSSSRYGPNRKTVAEDDEVTGNGWDTGTRQDHTDKIQWIAGRDLYLHRAGRRVAFSDRPKRFD